MVKILKKTKRFVYAAGKKTLITTKLFFDKGLSYDDQLLHRISNNQQKEKYLIIFSHFDRHGLIEPYVLHYLSQLKQIGVDIIFVSTAETLLQTELEKINGLCFEIVVKKNIGYDFGAWRTGISLARNYLDEYEYVILCNDSVYAPLFDLDKMFNSMQGKYDFWGITDNYMHGHHIQSYFMVFTKKVFLQDYFLDFWKKIRVFKHKENIVRYYEVGLTKLLRKHNIDYGVYCPSDYQSKMNTTHHEWKKLIIDQQCPIIKIELLRDNPTKTDISDWEDVINSMTSYDSSLIRDHLMSQKNSL